MPPQDKETSQAPCAVLLVLAPVHHLAGCIAVLGNLAARATLYLGEHRAAVKADAAMRLVCWPVLQLAVGVAVPRTITGTGEDDL